MCEGEMKGFHYIFFFFSYLSWFLVKISKHAYYEIHLLVVQAKLHKIKLVFRESLLNYIYYSYTTGK